VPVIIAAFRLFFDGSCAPRNPGGIAIGAFRILSPDGQLLHADAVEECRGPGATNNVAEWAGLKYGISWIRQHRPEVHQLRIVGDSMLVIRQLNRTLGCRKPHLQHYRDECLALLQGIHWLAEWVAREANQEADALTRVKYQEICNGSPTGFAPGLD
jgi:ribonuclease HI